MPVTFPQDIAVAMTSILVLVFGAEPILRPADPRTTLRYDMAKANVDRTPPTPSRLPGRHEHRLTTSVQIKNGSRHYPRAVSDQVVGLGAWCDFVPEEESSASPGSVAFDVHEFALLADGRRVTLHAGERGFAVSGPRRPTAGDPLAGMTAECIEAGVRTTVLPDEDDSEEEHPYEWLRELLLRQGIAVTVASLRSVPYTVEFSERLRQLLAQRTSPCDE